MARPRIRLPEAESAQDRRRGLPGAPARGRSARGVSALPRRRDGLGFGLVDGHPEPDDRRRARRGRRVGGVPPGAGVSVARGPRRRRSSRAGLLDGVGAELGSERLLIGGESAGGYMTAAVALRIREMGAIDRVDGLNLNMGIHDWGGNPSQHGVRPTEGPDVLSPEFVQLARDCLRARHDRRRAAGARGLALLCRSPGSCRRASCRSGPPTTCFDDSLTVRHPRRGRRRRRRLLRPPRPAARVPGVRLRDHPGVGASARPMDGRAHRLSAATHSGRAAERTFAPIAPV